ncbi:hypothetical protein GCM10023224_04890 [Streptomonospora halophila]|uniref:Uncharacterized protein n=1 Tax=Streptomonospora halophila TaxID=427369 RepID=A0ABP9G525_9ACTN
MELPPDDGREVTDQEWEAVRAALGTTGDEPTTREERAALLENYRKSWS